MERLDQTGGGAMSELSQEGLRSILSQRTPETWVEYLTIESDDLAEPVRVCRNGEDIQRSEGLYYGAGFDVELPTAVGEELPTSTVSVADVEMKISKAMRSISGVPTARLEVGLASQPDTIEVGPFDFNITSGTAAQGSVQLQLGFDEGFFAQTIPAVHYDPNNSPGVFQ